jgi:regulator of protease activity HflC (stomatin/prohibitin superfamily)
VVWPTWGLTWVPALIAVELALRALARLFLPEPSPASARAATESILADVFTRGPRAPAQLIRTHLGIDFSRSWALSYLSAALVPALVITAFFCWFLTGFKLIGTSERGVYEQFGAPVAVLGPGLHVLAPWPFGKVRPVEFGTIHSVATGTDEAADPAEDISAEDTPPTSLNRLWTTEHATQAQYLVASESGGKQTFQTINTEILVLYRIGLKDADAMQAVYGVINQQDVVRQAASRLALRYFGSRTLESVMGAQRESLQETLRSEIARDVAAAKGGIEIVGVVIEEIHPPAGAAAAYHAVQAAGINAEASISTEIGRAAATSGTAQSEAIQLLGSAQAGAVETVQTATGDAYRFVADKRGYDLSARSFLMEHRYRNLASALAQTPLTIIDHRLKTGSGTVIDMRASRAGQSPANASTQPDSSAADPAISDDQSQNQP